MKNFFETERLVLGLLDDSYAELVVDYYVRNRDFLQVWDPWHDEHYYTIDCQARLLKIDLDNMAHGRLLRLWLFKKNDNRRIIGCVVFNDIKREFRCCQLGYKLDQNEINQGYMTEALKKSIAFMLDRYALQRIEAYINPVNKPSLRVVEKLGFQRGGPAQVYLKINEQWAAHIQMVLINNKSDPN